MNKKVLIIIAIIVGLGGLATFAFYRTDQIVSVDYIKVEEETYYETIVATGKVVPSQVTAVNTEIAGMINGISGKKGDEVKKGEVLLKIDDWDLRLELQERRANYELAQIKLQDIETNLIPIKKQELKQLEMSMEQMNNQYVKNKILYENGAIPYEALEEMENQLSLQESNMEIAKTQLKALESGGTKRSEVENQIQQSWNQVERVQQQMSKYTVVAPMSGVILEKYVNLGEYTQSGNRLFEIGDLKEKYVELEIDERNLSNLAIGQQAYITPEAYPQYRIEGVVHRIAPNVDELTGAALVSIKLMEPEVDLLANVTVRVEIIKNVIENAMVISEAFIIPGEKTYVMVYVDGIATKREITIEGENVAFVRVTESLKAGEIVLIPNGLKEGDVVTLQRKRE